MRRYAWTLVLFLAIFMLVAVAESKAATIEIKGEPQVPVPLFPPTPLEFAVTGVPNHVEGLLNVKEYEQPAGICGELVWDHTSATFASYNLGEGSYINAKGESCYVTRADYDLWVTLFYNSRKLGRVVLAEREFETTDIVP